VDVCRARAADRHRRSLSAGGIAAILEPACVPLVATRESGGPGRGASAGRSRSVRGRLRRILLAVLAGCARSGALASLASAGSAAFRTRPAPSRRRSPGRSAARAVAALGGLLELARHRIAGLAIAAASPARCSSICEGGVEPITLGSRADQRFGIARLAGSIAYSRIAPRPAGCSLLLAPGGLRSTDGVKFAPVIVVRGHQQAPAWRARPSPIGNFDGVHAGHRALASRARELARPNGRCARRGVTFDPHPTHVLARTSPRRC